MAAAACSHGSHRFPGLRHSAVRGDQQQHQPPPQQQTPQQQQQQQSVRKRSDSRRRQAALHFLSNISLDGRLPLDVTNGFAELEPLDEATARLGSLSCISAIQSGALVTQMPRFGPGAGATYGGGGPVFTFPRDTSLCGQTQTPGAAEGNSEAPAAGAGAAAAGSGTPLLKSAAQGLLSPAQAASPFGLDLQKQRSRTSSGSPHPKNTKKVHFIKNMRQYDTRNSRIVLICAKRSLCSAFSVLPYGEFINNSDNKLDGQRQRNPSGGGGSSTDMILGLEGVELGVDGKDCVRPRMSINEEGLKVEPLKSVSYAQFLYPTNAFVTQRSVLEASGPCQPVRTSVHRNVASGRISNATVAMELGSESGDLIEYDPNLLDDPQWPCGKHKRVLIFASYMTTVIEYVKPSDLKKDMNETFKEKFPHIKLTLSKIRSLKREMRNLAEECNLEPCTVALSFVYFEKLVLQGKVNKQNRKLCSGACLLLAAKISSDLKKYEVKHLIDKLEERLRLNSKELVSFEFAALVALEFGLYLPGKKVFPHYRRLVQQS